LAWLTATGRGLRTYGIPVRTFVDPAETNRVGLIVEVPDMDAFRLDEHHNRFGTNPVKSHSVGRHLGFHHLQ